MAGLVFLIFVTLLFIGQTIAFCLKRDWAGAMMCFGSVIFTIGQIWKFSDDV
jgi:hypothetical protein